MSIEMLTRIGFVLAGLLVMGWVFCLYAGKRLTVEIAMAWEAAGAGCVLVGLIPALSKWCRLLSFGTVTAMFLLGAVAVWAGLRFSILLSVLQMKTQELAVQISLLKEENRQLAEKLLQKEERQEPAGAGKTGRKDR